MKKLSLPLSLVYQDLQTHLGLKEVDHLFLIYLEECDSYLYHQLQILRKNSSAIPSNFDSSLSLFLLTLAPYIEKFIQKLFSIEQENQNLQKKLCLDSKIGRARQVFVQKRVANRYNSLDCHEFDLDSLKSFFTTFVSELDFATHILMWLKDESLYSYELQQAIHYTAWALYTEEGRQIHKKSILFHTPQKIDFTNLVPHQKNHSLIKGKLTDQIYRSGFNLQDPCPSSDYGLREATYCLYCHKQNKDSCSKGLRQKAPLSCEKSFVNNPFEEPLKGCPLDQKISEMNLLYAEGHAIAALAMITLDNPLVAATGHRICQDCSKACIFQKQDPVDIPVIETRILKDVLELPWGLEIYHLLMKWNPLNLISPYPAASSGYRVLVVGQGPAGFALAHYLLNEGHEVLAIDGLKIEPLDTAFHHPIYKIQDHVHALEDRTISGFGGVAEYGITSRWDKNNLLFIRSALEKRPGYALKGSTRFQSQITLESAYEQGFDHIALCTGAEQPRPLPLKNSLAQGVHFAADFLMSLYLQGAYRKESLTFFPLKSPILVIGGGLTAVDAATEARFFYKRQQEFSDSFPSHSLGDVTIIYYKAFEQSPAYRLNAHELKLSLAQGVKFLENSIPQEIIVDERHHVTGLKIRQNGHQSILQAGTILIATGTIDPLFENYMTYPNLLSSKAFFIKIDLQHRGISVFGDLHPFYKGSVVKALASAKNGFSQISALLRKRSPTLLKYHHFVQELDAKVVQKIKHSEKVTELVIQAPAAAKAFQPGQFFRLQNFDPSLSSSKSQMMKALALTGAWADVNHGLLTFFVKSVGLSSAFCQSFSVGQAISLMGPTGSPFKILFYKKVLIIGEDLGNSFLSPLAQAFKQNNNKVIQLAIFNDLLYLQARHRFEATTHQLIWAIPQTNKVFKLTRSQDKVRNSNLKDIFEHFDQDSLYLLQDFDQIIVMGSNKFLKKIEQLPSHFFKKHQKIYAYLNSPMQCMMQGLCGQCLQKTTDPHTGIETFYLSCAQHYQELKNINFEILNNRLI